MHHGMVSRTLFFSLPLQEINGLGKSQEQTSSSGCRSFDEPTTTTPSYPPQKDRPAFQSYSILVIHVQKRNDKARNLSSNGIMQRRRRVHSKLKLIQTSSPSHKFAEARRPQQDGPRHDKSKKHQTGDNGLLLIQAWQSLLDRTKHSLWDHSRDEDHRILGWSMKRDLVAVSRAGGQTPPSRLDGGGVKTHSDTPSASFL